MAGDEAQGGLPRPLTAHRQALGSGLVAGKQAWLLEAHRLGVGLAGLGRLPRTGAALGLEGASEPHGGAAGDAGDLLGAGRGQRVEAQSSLGLPHVDAIEGQNVEMDIESERRIRSLDGDHCAGERFPHAAEAEQLFGAASQRAHQLAGEGAGGAGAELGVVAQHRAHAPRETTDPVTEGDFWQDRTLEMHGTVAHATGQATGTKTPAFAAERNELGVAALPALEFQEAKV